MKQTLTIDSLRISLTLCMLATAASAHRLDECLVATRVDVRSESIAFEIIVIPGVDLMPTFMEWIDENADGSLSQAEAKRFAEAFMKGCLVKVNNKSPKLTLTKVTLPDTQKLGKGLGQLRIHAQARVTHVVGKNLMNYHCDYQPDQCVYLINALIPEKKHIRIGRQRRNRLQTDYQLNFTVAGKEEVIQDKALDSQKL